MKKTLRRIVPSDLVQALRNLGYYRLCYHEKKGEWKRGFFHLFVIEKKRKVTLNLHKDVYHWALPIPHGTINKGKEIENEFKRIVEAYQKQRGF